ncbi:unnamed protein product, partial [Ectocarpus sp. 4 AP-2014]
HRALPVDPVHGPQPLGPARRLLPHHAQRPYRPPRQGHLPTAAAAAARHRCRGGRVDDDSTDNHCAPAGGRLGVDSWRAADASSSRGRRRSPPPVVAAGAAGASGTSSGGISSGRRCRSWRRPVLCVPV